jgi:hypothetical protein
MGLFVHYTQGVFMKKAFLVVLVFCVSFGLFAAPDDNVFPWKSSHAVTLPLSQSWVGLTGLVVINVGIAREFKVDDYFYLEACADYFSLMGFFNIGGLEVFGRWYPAGRTFFMSLGGGYRHYWTPETSGTINNEFTTIAPPGFFGTVNIAGKLGWKIITNKKGAGFFVEPSLGYDYAIFLTHPPQTMQREVLMVLRTLLGFKANISLGWAI